MVRYVPRAERARGDQRVIALVEAVLVESEREGVELTADGSRTAVTAVESRPPERKTPSGTSLTRAASTARSRCSRSWPAAVSKRSGRAGAARKGVTSQ